MRKSGSVAARRKPSPSRADRERAHWVPAQRANPERVRGVGARRVSRAAGWGAAVVTVLVSCSDRAGRKAESPEPPASIRPAPAVAPAGARPGSGGVAPGLAEPSEQAASRPASLPRYFTVEVAPDGRLYADGVSVPDLAALSAVAGAASRRGTFAGAAVFHSAKIGSATKGSEGEVIGVLRAAGFEQPSLARRTPPREIRSFAVPDRKGPVSPSASARRPEVREPERQVARNAAPVRPPPGRALVVETVGLHVGGGARSEESRQRLVQLFERQFPAFAKCHALATERDRSALFGVDVYVPASGGRARVGEVRTTLVGEAFRDCMVRAIGAVRFPPPDQERPTAVSYSFVFKPDGR